MKNQMFQAHHVDHGYRTRFEHAISGDSKLFGVSPFGFRISTHTKEERLLSRGWSPFRVGKSFARPGLQPPLLCLIVSFMALGTQPAMAQRAQLQVQSPPHFVGDPVVIQFTLTGFDQSVEPQCTIESKPDGLRVQQRSVSPNVMSRTTIINGRVSQQTTVTWQLTYLLTAGKPGEYTVGPFVIKQGSKEARIDAETFEFGDVPLDPNMRILLLVDDRPVYPSERVPVTIEWWYAGDIGEVQQLNIHSPLFDSFRFAPDPPPRRGASQMPIDTKEGRVPLEAEARREEWQGKDYTVLSAKRVLIPDRPGQFQLEPITATVRKVTQWARQRSPFDDMGFGSSIFRDVMGDRRQAARTELARAVGEPLNIVIKTFPLAGRPESFAGAVGPGYSIDVSADRTVVRVGDPISLDIILRGSGNLVNAGLPPLSADGGMDPTKFRLPDRDASGVYENGQKSFNVTVRVQDETVSELPALAYSWFDPTDESYHTVHSKPIALRVMPAQIVGSADVVGSTNSKASKKRKLDDQQVAATGSRANGAAVASTSLTGADLAIETDSGVLLRDVRGAYGGLATQAFLYVAGLVLIGIAVLERKRRDIPRHVIEKRNQLRAERSRIISSRSQPKKQAAESLATALRNLVAAMPHGPRFEAQSIIAECESLVYAPNDSGDDRLDDELVKRALEVAKQFEIE
jgi:hypothetical protein